MLRIIHLAAITAGILLPATAFGHATLEAGEAAVGSTYKAVLRVPHGCDGKATNEVHVKLPEGFIAAKPMPKAGWALEIIRGKFQKTYDYHGTPTADGPLEIRWSGGALPDDQYDEFVVRGTFAGGKEGDVMHFVATQICGDAKVAWDEIAASDQNPHDLKHPAPSVTLVAAAKSDMHHGSGMAMTGSIIKAGDLELTGVWARATPPAARVAGGFLSITNHGSSPDRLTGGAFDRSGSVEVHEMAMDNGVMKMRKLADGLVIQPGETVELKPGGYHLMFMQLKEPLKEGETVNGVLTFEKAGDVAVTYPVMPFGHAGGGGDHSQHGGMTKSN